MNYEQLENKISALAKAENITKKLLGELSRELLAYVVEHRDVRPVNSLLGDTKGWKLSPVNWRFAAKYFVEFLPFTSNYEDVKQCINNGGVRSPLVFKKINKRSEAKKLEAIAAWLEDEANDIWVWSDAITIDDKPKDWAGLITKAVAKGVEKGGLNVSQVMAAVLAAEIDIDELVKAIADTAEPVQVDAELEEEAA